MSEGLKARAEAAKAGGRAEVKATGARGAEVPSEAIVFEVGDDPEVVPVRVAWKRVMRFCRALPKGSTATVNTKAGGSYTYRYRGIDDVISLAGRAMREMGVDVVPIEITPVFKTLGQMNSCTVAITYKVTGQSTDASDYFEIKSLGEGLDLGDKAALKAQTQAYRTAMITALSLPTYDLSLDSDATPIERPVPPTPEETRDEILRPNTSVQRLVAIQGELRNDRERAAAFVTVEGKQVRLWDLVVDTRKTRTDAIERLNRDVEGRADAPEAES